MANTNQIAKKNWIITDKGDLVNLDFVSKIQYGGNFSTPADTKVRICFGIAQGAGAVLTYVYADAATALASYTKLMDTILALEVAVDLR